MNFPSAFIIILFIFSSSLLAIYQYQYSNQNNLNAQKQNDFSCPDCNVIIILIDTFRFDHLSSYSYFLNINPNIDRLASNGVLFENAYATASWTLPSHMSIFTGVYPNKHGVNILYTRLPENITTLPEYLKARNYTNVWVSPLDSEVLNLSLGFNRGIDYTIDENNSLGNINFTEPLSWILKNSGKKFYMFLHTFVVHEPNIRQSGEKAKFYSDYNGTILDTKERLNAGRFKQLRDALDGEPDVIYEIFGEENVGKLRELINGTFTYKKWNDIHLMIKPGKEGLFYGNFEYWVGAYRDSMNLSDTNDVRYLNALYDESILKADEEIGRFIAMLNASSILNKTVIIILSDHGQEIGDHGDFGHYPRSLHEELVHVPLIIYNPQKPEGKRINALVSAVDILPTILDIVGIRIPDSASMHGRSLVPLISGSDSNLHKYIFGFTYQAKFVANETWKLMTYPNGTEELYNVANDRNEHMNLVSTRRDIAQELREIISDFESEEGKIFVINPEEASARLREAGYA